MTAWLIAEDEALKAHVRGMKVVNNDTETPVGVRFGLPEAEEGDVRYPLVTINMVDISEGNERAHAGRITPSYIPHGQIPVPTGMGAATEFPIPVNIDYQITTFARSAWHDRQIQAQMLGDKFPFKHGVLYVPSDGSRRTMMLLEWQSIDGLDVNNKRQFRKAYTLRVFSELFLGQIEHLHKVQRVVPTIKYDIGVRLIAPRYITETEAGTGGEVVVGASQATGSESAAGTDQ